MHKALLIMILAFGMYPSKSTAQHNTFYIGHSGFGWDLIVGEMVNDLAADAGIATYDYNYQFIGGTCISNQWESSSSPQGGVSAITELPNGYDVVVLAEQIPIQEVIYGSPWGCSMTSVQAVDSFYNLATAENADARVYLMEYHNEVNLTLGSTPYADWTDMNAAMRPLWEQVADSVTLVNPGGPGVCIVPVAAAFEAMTDSIWAGVFPGYTDWLEVFDPDDIPEAMIHPTEETYYLVACVHYACIFGESPVGLTNTTIAAEGWAFDPPTPAQAAMMQEIAWEIVSNDPYACLPATSAVQETSVHEFSVFPNPSEGVLNVDFGSASSGILEVMDIMGQKVQQHQITNPFFEIEVEAGIYLLQFISEEGDRLTEKVIVK
jgi:hypothetical protein